MRGIPSHLSNVFKVIREAGGDDPKSFFLDALTSMALEAIDASGIYCELLAWNETLNTKYQRDIERLSSLVEALAYTIQNNKYCDILGEVYEYLRIGSARKGQYLTPQVVTNGMAEMEVEGIIESLKTVPVRSVSDPTCGSGAFLLSVAQAVQNAGYDPAKKLVLKGLDIDDTMVKMCYIQLTYNCLCGSVKDTGKGALYLTPLLIGRVRGLRSKL